MEKVRNLKEALGSWECQHLLEDAKQLLLQSKVQKGCSLYTNAEIAKVLEFNVEQYLQTNAPAEEQLKCNTLIAVHLGGQDFDLETLGINRYIPNTDKFVIFEYLC